MRSNGPQAAPVTVVTGVPRSGTSLVMQMLAAGGIPPLCDGERPPDQDNPRGYFEYAPAKSLARDASWLALARGRALKLAHTLVPALPSGPRYRVLLVRRRLDEVLASQRAMLARAGESPDEDGDARLAPALAAQLERLERWLDARADVAWLALEHRELVHAPAPACERLARFLGGGLDADAMSACADPALHRHQR
jgi:hypothetical protein